MTVLLHQYLGGEGCGLQVVKAQQRVQQEGGVESWEECLCGDWLRAGKQHHAGGR